MLPRENESGSGNREVPTSLGETEVFDEAVSHLKQRLPYLRRYFDTKDIYDLIIDMSEKPIVCKVSKVEDRLAIYDLILNDINTIRLLHLNHLGSNLSRTELIRILDRAIKGDCICGRT